MYFYILLLIMSSPEALFTFNISRMYLFAVYSGFSFSHSEVDILLQTQCH